LIAGNSIGRQLVLTTFGESHGPAVGGVLDGFPGDIEIDPAAIQQEINRRNPTGYPFATTRKEPDELEILSGIFEGKSTGAPIAFLVRNQDARPEDYDHLRNIYRPSHADYTYAVRYSHRDHRGGGRASARTTLAIVAGGAFARIILDKKGITVRGYVSRIGPVALPSDFRLRDPALIQQSSLVCPDEETTRNMTRFLKEIQSEGDTAGGIVAGEIRGMPAGIGSPLFHKLQADLAHAMFSINAVKGFEFGSGFSGSCMKGSEHNDEWNLGPDGPETLTNHSGGLQGGISNGMPVTFAVAFKPISSLSVEQRSIDNQGQPVSIPAKGRHDVCIAPRSVPIVEALACLVIADHLLFF